MITFWATQNEFDPFKFHSPFYVPHSIFNRQIIIQLEFPPTWSDAIHSFKWVKIIQIWRNGGQLFLNSCWLTSSYIFNMFERWYAIC